jgi:DNA-binding LytR/AlgR family response regulator
LTHAPIENENKVIHIKSNLKNYRLELKDICYIESKKEYSEFNLDSGEIISSRMTMVDVMDLVGAFSFIQIHRSFIVQKEKIKSISNTTVELSQKTLPLGRSYKAYLENFWNNL